MPTAPQTPAEYHHSAAERGIADLGKLGLDEPERAVEVLVALTHAVLALYPDTAVRSAVGSREEVDGE